MLVFATALVCGGQVHHPAWWSWIEPDATALVGIRWDVVRASKAATAVEGALFSAEGAGLPALECLKQAEQLLLSSPRSEAIFWGSCTISQLREQATRKGFRRAIFQETELWYSPTWSLVHLGAKLVLCAPRALLEETLENRASDQRRYSPLLAQAAVSKTENIWMVANGKPPVAFLYLGQLQSVASEPQVVAKLEPAKPQPEPIRVVNGNAAAMVTPTLAAVVPPAEVPKPGMMKLAPPKRVIRITGLDDGPREIELPSP